VYFSFLLLCFLVFVLPSGVIKNDDNGLDEAQRRGIWTYEEMSLRQKRLASLEAWTCLKKQSTQESGREIMMQCAALNTSNRCIIFSSAH